jgi:uncharacterized protein (TIGR03067 family)
VICQSLTSVSPWDLKASVHSALFSEKDSASLPRNGAGQKGDFREAKPLCVFHDDPVNITRSCLTLALAGLLTACATSTHTMKNADNLIGTWACVSAVVDGKRLPDETCASLRLTLTEHRYKTEKGSEVLFDSTYTIDASKHPNEINMVGTEGDLTGKEAQGIYSVQNDTLQICYTMPGAPRPTEFKSPAGAKAYLIQGKRLR